MKSSFLDDIKEKFKKANEVPEDDYYDDYDEDYNEEYDDYENNDYSEPEYTQQSAPVNKTSYSADSEYDFGYTPSKPKTNNTSSYKSNSASDSKYSRYGNSNIYKMNNEEPVVQKAKISKVVYFVLEDAEDARNIADCMINKDSVILVDITKLSNDDAMKVLNFLDGVRYICKSSIETISNIQLIVPESVELTGDFFDQMSQGTFLG